MIVVSGLRLPLGSTGEEAIAKARAKLKLSTEGSFYVRKQSFDMRRGKGDMVCSVVAVLGDQEREKQIAATCEDAVYAQEEEFVPVRGSKRLKNRPVIAGFGPAGMFAGLLLSEYGYRPIILERGEDVDTRVRTVEGFFSGGEFNTVTNIQFGEGGAGTFSDGKLTTRINDPLCEYVLNRFVEFGAPEEILVRQKPHIGTDNLRNIVKNIRKRIIENGGEVRFCSCLNDIEIRNGKVEGCRSGEDSYTCETLILACGHSARDTVRMLSEKGIVLEAKPFSVGFRVEHLQEDVDRALYGKLAGHPALPRGEYNLSSHAGERGVYTFCMCPGGKVVAAASEEGGAVTNGMSEYLRDGENANSAVCISVLPEDFNNNPFRAVEFQRELERRAFAAGGRNYGAPAADMGSFMSGATGLRLGKVKPTYPRDIRAGNFDDIFGNKITNNLRQGLRDFSGKLECFKDREAIITGVETRTSSPVRIPRGENRQAEGVKGLYPCGEGAGYAGGITSAAVDGLRCAAAIIEEFDCSL